MSSTIPFELNGAEYIAEAVSSKNAKTNQVEYFVKINGDPACFVNFGYGENAIITEESSSPDLTPEFKAALKKALIEYLSETMRNN